MDKKHFFSRKDLFRSLILFFILFSSAPVFSQYFNHENETDQLKRIYALNSVVFPTSSYPVSRKQLIVFAENLNSLISDPLFSSELSSLIKKLKNSDTIGIKASATGTYNYRTKELWPDYYRNFFDISPVFDVYMQLSSDIVAIEAREIWRREFQYFPDTNLTEAKEGDLFAAENQFLYLGLLSYQFEGMELLIGRAPVHFGDNDFNSLLPSKRLPFLDMVEIKIPIGPFELTGQVATLENREALEDDYSGDGSGDFDFGRNTILTALHRFEYRGERLRAAVAGFSVISRPDNGFMLGDVFPVFAWHTADVGWHNLALIGDFSCIPMEGLNLFFQTGFDDINASDLFGVNDSDIPTVYAFIFGTSYFKDLEKSRFRAAFEAGKTHYLWGNFYAPGDSDEDGDHYFEKAVYRVFMDGSNRILPLTSPYGPGAFWSEISAGFYEYRNLDFILKILVLNKNSEADILRTPFAADKDIENADSDIISNISFHVNCRPEGHFSYFMEPALVFYNSELAFEMVLGGRFTFSRFGKY